MADLIVTQMRRLKLEFDRGDITAAMYERKFQIINESVGERCECGRGTVTVWRGHTAICARCELEGR